jgi:hypothetical protein
MSNLTILKESNIASFISDFMFQLSEAEIAQVVSQKLIPSRKYFGGAEPFAFTEQGVAMLSGILKGQRAVNVNIAIMRTFVKLRQLIQDHKDLIDKIDKLEDKYDEQFKIVFTALRQLLKEDNKPRPRIGFRK